MGPITRTIDVDPDRIIVMSSSAGGGIAAGAVLMARARGAVPVSAQVLL